MKKVFDKVFENLEHHFPFVVFANPNESILKGYFQKNGISEVFENQSGFVFAPFLKEEVFVISEKNSLYLETPIDAYSSTTSSISVEDSLENHKHFEKIIASAKQEIHNNTFKKVVLSRKIELEAKVDLERTFLSILENYKNTFRYLLYHPKFGIWTGATPERLLEVNDNRFKTVALAGTQLFSNDLHWQTKEKQEQQYVTDFIVSQLEPLATELIIGSPETIQAGNIAHIKTKIEGTSKDSSTTIAIINALHPTPAVCGSPQKDAKEFILENENYDREFYTGFLGPISSNGTSASIMVNLRCMKIQDDVARIFVGGGITSASIPDDEWKETQNKMQTMLQVLKPML